MEKVIGVIYLISILVFGCNMSGHPLSYTTAIDPIANSNCYTPFANEHLLTLQVYFLLFNFSALIIWIKGIKLPPLILVLCLIFLMIGIIINVPIIFHLSEHNIINLYRYDGQDDANLFLVTPSLGLIIGICLIIRVVRKKSEVISEVFYSNKILNRLNKILIKLLMQPLLVILLLIPIFLIITIILTLFGQHADSLVRVFTDTATWRLSQKIHPPIIPHVYQDDGGHYLCTVAANGSPNVVKPIRYGKRGGRRIIVNRQLMIANAFENLLEDYLPKFHKFIRHNYDKYGLDLSKRINTPLLSNLTYLLMKPLEYFFLICLYLFDNNPEKRINRQYAER